jgi:hypothetical protein
MERAMGIEDIDFKTLTSLNHGVTAAGTRCGRFLCEKWRSTSPRQPMPFFRPGQP